MNRRAYLAASASALAGCLSGNGGGESPQPGTVDCAEGLSASTSTGPTGGGWPTLHHDMQNTSAALEQTATAGCPKTQWTWEYEELPGGLDTSPIVVENTVFLADPAIDSADTPYPHTKLIAFDAATGEVAWRFTDAARAGSAMSTPTIVEGMLYLIGTGAIYAISLAERTTQWSRIFEHAGGNHWIYTPRVVDDTLYLGIRTGHVKALDAATGNTRWTFTAEGVSPASRPDEISTNEWAEHVTGSITSPVAVADNTVYACSEDFNLYALDATSGTEQWRFQAPATGAPPIRRSPMHAPVIDDGWVFAQTDDARVYALDATDGTVRWRFHEHETASNGVSPAVDTDTVYAVAGTSTENLFLYALVKATGEERWRTRISPPESGPCVDATHVYIASGYDFLAMDKQTGDVQWQLPLDEGTYAQAALVDGALFMVDVTGHLYGIW